MPAILNLQLSSIELSDEPARSGLLAGAGSRPTDTDFANALRARIAPLISNASLDGGFLPLAGKTLPQTLQPVEVELPVELVPDALTDVVHEDAAESIAVQSDVRTPQLLPEIDAPRLTPPITTAALEIPARPQPRVAALVNETQDRNNDARASMRASIPTRPVVFAPLEARGPRSGENIPVAAPLPGSLAGRTLSRAPNTEANRLPIGERPAPIGQAKHSAVIVGELQSTRLIADTVPKNVRLPISGLQAVSGSTHGQPDTLALTATHSPQSVTADIELATNTINTPVRDALWGERVAERVMMLAGSQVKAAEIRLTPAELGPLKVQLTIEDGVTHVAFQSQHLVTRDALEQAMPRLRELLAENGLTLGQSSVSEQNIGQGRGEQNTASERQNSTDAGDDRTAGVMPDDHHDVEPLSSRVANALIDTFA